MPKRRRTSLSLVAAAAAAAVTVPILAQAGPGNPAARLPDLVVNEESLPANPVFNVYAGQFDNTKLLLRFDGFVHNVGDGPLDLQGDPRKAAGTPGAVEQYLSTQPPTNLAARISTAAAQPGNWVPVTGHKDPVVVFDSSDTHNHWHVQKAAEYSLWNEAKTAQVVPGQKVGFCLYDSRGDSTPNGPSPVYSETTGVITNFCQQGNPNAPFLREGVSEGYMDVYDATLDFQWIDVSNIPPGRYYLAARMDPDNHIKEKDEDNKYGFSAAPVVVPGFRASAVTTSTAFRTAKPIALTSQRFNPTVPIGPDGAPPGYAIPGTVRYRVESLPANGVLRNGSAPVVAGTTLPAGVAQLTYTPNPNFSGQDTFAFSAVNFVGSSPSKYPLQPAQATAAINVGGSGITVNVSGIPGQMVVGTQAQFTAIPSSGGVTWTVNGVAGGNPAVGTVTPTGLYTAPAAVPAGGKVTVQALSTEDLGARSAPVDVGIVAEERPVPKPIIGGTVKKPGVLAVGRNVTISVLVPKAGTITLSLHRGAKRLGQCVTKVTAGQTATCKLQMSKPFDPGTLRVRSVFVSGGSVTRGSVSVGGSSFSRVAVKRRGGKVTFSVAPKRSGLVRVVVTRKGRVVAQCSARVLPGRALTCTRSVGRGSLGLSVSLKDLQGRLVVRESRL